MKKWMFKHSLSRNLDPGQQRSSLAATFWWWFCGHWEGAAQNIVFLNISLTPLWLVWPGDQATQTGCAIRSVETTTILTPINRCVLINKSRLQWEINRWLAEEIFPFSMLLTTSWMKWGELHWALMPPSYFLAAWRWMGRMVLIYSSPGNLTLG